MVAHPPSPVLPPGSRLHGLSQRAIQAVVAAAQALDLGRADEAERHITGLLALYPQHPEVLRLLGGAQRLRGDVQGAVATLQRASELRPGDALYLNTLGIALDDLGDYDAAIATLRRASEINPDLASVWYNLGISLVRSMRPAEATIALRRAVALAPDNVNAQCTLADQIKATGDVAGAVAEYRRILARHPHAGMAWWGLADIKTRRFDPADIAHIEQALRAPRVSDDDRIALGFALAKAYEDEGRYADSLEALARANALARTRFRWNAEGHAALVDATLAAFDPPPAPAADKLGSEVIFIVSLPRSGSSLIEQVLASHSQVDGAGELPDLPAVLTEESMRRNQPLANWAPVASAADWERLGRRYLERTAHWRERRPRFTDKLPGNWLYVGAIRAMLPGARIVIARRDPLETCLSCYRQRLTGNEYSRTFADLAAYWRDFDRAARRWSTLHPQSVREQVHEALVAEPEAQIRALLDFCNLDFEPSCLDFHTTVRDVHTPSAAQVREPLRRDTARAARYGGLLDPLRAALGMPPFSPADRPYTDRSTHG
jgi:tetratricopeptide (TPR) repeat protein